MGIVLAAFALAWLVLPATTAQAQIQIMKARIGCLDIQKDANLTALVKGACDGRMTCSYKAPTPAEYGKAGVRAATRTFCTQAMEITYRCQGGGSQFAAVPGDAWNHPAARLVCHAPVVTPSRPKEPALVPILKDILKRYERCIIERYETRETSHLPMRDRSTCADGKPCTLASRDDAHRRLQQLAANGDARGFEGLLKSAVLGDCMKCDKHRKWHTKHTHCTMDCGGNNGLIEGPCFESCKAGVDINAFLGDMASEIAKHSALFAGNFTGQGAQHVADLENTRLGFNANASSPSTVASNRSLVMPTDAESCDASTNGYYAVPEDRNLLDWKPAGAGPSWNEFITGYSPPGAVTPSTFLAPWSAPAVLKAGGVGIGANEGRLRADLRAVARASRPLDALCKSAAAFATGKHADGRAFADLSVTGRRAYAAFKAHPPQVDDLVACLKRDAKHSSRREAELEDAVNAALERAYRVATVLRAGGWSAKCTERDALGYIAVSGEDDQPHRPVNVPSAEFTQHDLDVAVGRVTVRTRYMIAERRGSSPSCAYKGMTIEPEPAPKLSPDAEVILFIHGMDSRLEEAMHLTHALHKLGEGRDKNYTVIALDMPTSGYADNLDYNKIAPLNAIGRATILPGNMGFAPAAGYKVPILDFNEDFIVEFLKTLEKKVPGVTKQLRAVVGGSMGGNLALRLGRPRADAPFITAAVTWSPAGMWESKSDNDVEHIALALPWAFAGGDARFKDEQPWSRNAFFYGGFDWQGKAAFIINVTQPQAQAWYGPSYRCRDSAIRLSRIGRYETYDANFRRWHWRLAAEQLIFSHRNKKSGQPLYANNTHRLLLMCGIDDTAGGLCEATRQVAFDMKYTPGHALWLKKTGHSIQDERPNFLGRHIADFIAKPAPGISLELDVARTGPALSIAASASPEACRDLCRGNTQCRAYSYIRHARLAGGRCTLLRRGDAKTVNVDAVSGVK